MKRRLIFDGAVDTRVWAWRVLSFLGSADLLRRDRGHGHRRDSLRLYGCVVPSQQAKANDHRRVLQTCAVRPAHCQIDGGSK